MYVQICPELNANEIQIPHDKHHKVSSLIKSHQKSLSSIKYDNNNNNNNNNELYLHGHKRDLQHLQKHFNNNNNKK